MLDVDQRPVGGSGACLYCGDTLQLMFMDGRGAACQGCGPKTPQERDEALAKALTKPDCGQCGELILGQIYPGGRCFGCFNDEPTAPKLG
ncbi:MAG: hypothetical protein ACPHK8_00690, partial [Thermoplasmatota archaeon]